MRPMATHPLQALTPSAIDIVDRLSLAAGDSLSVQVRGQRAAHYFEGASAPADATAGNEQLPGRWAYFTVTAGSPIWYWCPHADGTRISVND